MVNVIAVPPSVTTMPPAPPMPVLKEGEMRPSEATTLKGAFEEIVVNDPRCKGLAAYIANIRIFWSRSIPTACAGHGFIFFNPDFYDSIPEETRITVCVHEVWHLILKHLERGKNCDPRIHNIAADHVINIALEQDGFTFDGTTPYKDVKYERYSTDQVYNMIYKEEKGKQLTLADLGSYTPAEKIEDMIEDIVNSEGKTLEQQKEKAEKEVDDHKKSTGIGKSGSTAGITLELTNHKVMTINVTYEEIFREYLTEPLSSGSRTFMRPNRRFLNSGNKIILPGRLPKKRKENRLAHLVYALDVSGSISEKNRQQFHDSVRTIKELLKPKFLTVIFFNHGIVFEKTFSEHEVYGTLKIPGGGGTNLTDVYRRTEELKPEALVIFTDLCVNIPPVPSFECIWLVPETYHTLPSNINGEVYLIPDKK